MLSVTICATRQRCHQGHPTNCSSVPENVAAASGQTVMCHGMMMNAQCEKLCFTHRCCEYRWLLITVSWCWFVMRLTTAARTVCVSFLSFSMIAVNLSCLSTWHTVTETLSSRVRSVLCRPLTEKSYDWNWQTVWDLNCSCSWWPGKTKINCDW